MRDQPTLRIPLGVLALLVGLAVYAGVVVWASPWIGAMPVWAQTVVYLVLGIAWLLPLKRFLIWMETGRWVGQSPHSTTAVTERILAQGKERGVSDGPPS